MNREAGTQQKVFFADNKLQQALEATGIATWQLQLPSGEFEYSPNFCDVTGLSKNTRHTLNEIKKMVQPEDLRDMILPAYRKGLKTGIMYLETRLNVEKGRQRWIKCTCKIISQKSDARQIVGTVSDISEQVESARRDSQLAALVSSSQDAIVIKSLDGKVLSWNKSAERIFGYTSEEMVGKSILRLFPPDRIKEEEHIISQIVSGKMIDHFETQRLAKGGRLIDLSLSLSPITDASGKITSVSKIARDITRQKQAERVIAENEQRLQIVIEASGLGMWELDTQNGSINYTDSYLKMLGYRDGTGLTAEKLKNHVHPDDLPIRNAAFKRADKTGKLHYHCRIFRTTGEERWMEVRGRAYTDQFGNPMRYLGTIRDVTEDRLQNEKLQESEKKFRLLANSMPQFVWTSDAEGKLNYFNNAVFEFTGLNNQQLRGAGWVEIIHPDDIARNIELWQKAVRDGTPFLCEHRFRRHNGSYRWQLSRAVPHRDENGHINLWIGTSTDVHEHKTFSEELEKSVQVRTAELKNAVEELTRMNQQLEQFAYVSSHDLQEPLRKIQTFAGLLADRYSSDDEKATHFLSKIRSSASRMSDLIKDLLQYSRLDKEAHHFSPVDLATVVEKVKNDFEVMIAEKGAKISCDKLPVVNGVEPQLNHLFYNLISNALKFCDKPPVINITSRTTIGADVTLTDELNQTSEYHEISVQDNGIGFSTEYAQKIFTIFQRLNNREKYEGTGVGLAICKRIVENHSGVIVAESAEGQGSTFTVYFPA